MRSKYSSNGNSSGSGPIFVNSDQSRHLEQKPGNSYLETLSFAGLESPACDDFICFSLSDLLKVIIHPEKIGVG